MNLPIAKLKGETIKAVNQGITKHDHHLEIGAYHLFLFGHNKMNTVDRASVQHYVNRIQMYLDGNKDIVAASKAYRSSLIAKPHRRFADISNIDDINFLTHTEAAYLKRDYEETFTNIEKLSDSKEFDKLRWDRLIKFKAGVPSAIQLQQDKRDMQRKIKAQFKQE